MNAMEVLDGAAYVFSDPMEEAVLDVLPDLNIHYPTGAL